MPCPKEPAPPAPQTELDTLGYTAEEYIGQPIMKFCPDEEALVLDIFKELGSGNSIKDVPVRFRTKSGKIVPLLIDSNVAYKMDESGEKVFNHTRCFIRDDTGRRVRQARMDSLLKEAERTQELFDAYASRTLHLVKTPCHVVQQSIDCVVMQLARLRLPEEPARVVKDASAMLRGCAEQMAGVIEMVNDAGDAMKFEQGAVLRTLPTATSLLEAGRTAVERVLPLVKEGAKVRFEHDSGPSVVYLDQRVLQRALGHLLRNAAEATPAGGAVTLSIIHTCTPAGERVRFEVRDTGRGLDATQSDVFRLRFHTPAPRHTGRAEHFSHEAEAAAAAIEEARNDLALKLSLGSHQANGLGLGLRLSYGLVHALGGELRVLSEPGDTSFYFSLPAVGASQPVEGGVYTAGSASMARAAVAPAADPSRPPAIVVGGGYTGSQPASASASPLRRKREFQIPKQSKRHASSAEIAGLGLAALERPHVLVVEDTNICATILCLLLKQIGCTSAVAENGAIALQMLRDLPTPRLYSIVLMDLRMPVMDGFEATRVIKAENLIEAPIVALTAEEGFDTRQMCDEIGFDGFYSKPTSLDTLKALLKTHLGYECDDS